jgi:hypothetical protein
MSQAVLMPAIGSTVSAICYDSECGTVLKMGSPPFVQSYAKTARDKFLASRDPIIAELADSIRVVTGPFSDEEFERIRDCSSYILRSHALSDPRFSIN